MNIISASGNTGTLGNVHPRHAPLNGGKRIAYRLVLNLLGGHAGNAAGTKLVFYRIVSGIYNHFGQRGDVFLQLHVQPGSAVQRDLLRFKTDKGEGEHRIGRYAR
ncbi:hypothetical protein SDC9_85230 [bioreactor metagenome]|uniref:Uncharacterized protein n=1 Tax=bioreactor metagenome TaxID=1076179 RepID=A0A644ZFD8_9ZZZZ